MANKIKTSTVLRRNYREMIFVFVTFALMVMAAYFFIGRVLRERLLDRAGEMIYTAEANVRAGLSEAETHLLNSYHTVRGMVEQNASRQEILDYLIAINEWMRRQDRGLLGFYGIYGIIRGELYDSMNADPGDDFIPQTRPWYQAAVRSNNTVAYTSPYLDWSSGNTVVSAVRNIDIENGDIAGILVLDINISWLVEYVTSLSPAAGGYGMLLSQNMTLIAHPDDSLTGRQFQDLGGSYPEVARTLRGGGKVSGLRIKDPNGISDIVFFSRIFNGWYVGITAHYFDFYRDLNFFAVILVLLGIVFSLSLCYILLRLSAARMRADEESKSKSSFLANMSHEIRTPMNAITGMAELLLRGDLSDEARGYAQDIKQAGSNLISIINDILDFSKIEAGKLEIVPTRYMLSSLVNDTVNIIRMRLMEKPIRFYTNIDGNIPNNLIGDEVRIRQILLNLLSNAVKYSEKGNIGLSIAVVKREDKQIWLKVTVKDTGKGIKPEDREKLFGDFVQFDMKKNRGIEGTGLGLAIAKRLCRAMGGDIGVESEYGKGSTFTAVIPQGIDSKDPFAAVEEPERKKVLVYEGRSVYAKSICWSLDNMRIPHTIVANQNDFAEALIREEWFFVFSGYGLYDKIKPVMENAAFPGGKRPPLALMVEWGTEAYIPNVRFVSLPIQSLSIANVLNGRADGKGYAESSGVIRFTIPGARLLIVDDIFTNLKVADGLLAPYRAKVDTCLSGADAIEMVKRYNYDIVFMDHMMPEMDGIEATEIIRELDGDRFKTLPIIALTANAVVGMKEMFIEKGLNDFLAKPIDVSKLDEILDRWIPKEKKGNRELEMKNEKLEMRKESEGSPDSSNCDSQFPISHSSFLNIPGVDIQRGISLTGGKTELYLQVLSVFCKDAEERLPLLQTVPEADTLLLFVTQVHALKSASASIGAAEVSAGAAGLEAAGKAGDFVFIREKLPVFAEHLAGLVKNIHTALESHNGIMYTENVPPETPDSSPVVSIRLLRELETALQSQKANDIDRILEELGGRPPFGGPDAKTKEILDQISDEVLMAEYGKAGEILKDLIQRENNR